VPIDPNDPVMPDQSGFADHAAMQDQFNGLFGFVVFLFVVFAIVGILLAIRNAGKAIDKGQNPLTVDYDLKLKALGSQVLAAEKSTDEKLAEVERLFSAGSITADERAAARERILSSL
jgi:competence protein ComGC